MPEPAATSRERAIACARAIYYYPERVVDELIATSRKRTAGMANRGYGVAQFCYEHSIRLAATVGVLGLRPLHWPMLNLLDAAERDRRAFADAMAAAVLDANEQPFADPVQPDLRA